MSKSKKPSAPSTSNSKAHWREQSYAKQQERLSRFSTISDLEIPELVTAEDLNAWSESEQLGLPGEFPFTRGVQPSMYRGKLWTMRQFAGFGRPADTNKRFKYLLEHGQTGLSTAFDMPTLMGYDPGHELSFGEVGREGVSVATIEDMEELFADIDLRQVTTSMTINCSATPILAMYFAVGRRRGIDWNAMGGTIQNDILKEYIAQKEWICPPKPGLRLACDIIEFCTTSAKIFNPVSISGYHIREAGATAAQELAFTLYDGITYVEECLRRGMPIDTFAPRLSFFWDVHNDFFEEIAKFRASRRMWARIMQDRFGTTDVRSMRLRTHAQTAGVSLTAQQPLNNIARVALQALAAVLGGTQSLHTNSMDETYALPTEEAVKVALRTQQIIAEESGVANTIDPLGGSYFVESLTDKLEAEANHYIEKLDAMGGMLVAIEKGFPQREISDSAYRYQKQVESGEKAIVGISKYMEEEEGNKIPTLKIDPTIEKEQTQKLETFKRKRNNALVSEKLTSLRQVAQTTEGLMPVIIEAVDAGASVGEVCQVFREVFGEYRDPGLL